MPVQMFFMKKIPQTSLQIPAEPVRLVFISVETKSVCGNENDVSF